LAKKNDLNGHIQIAGCVNEWSFVSCVLFTPYKSNLCSVDIRIFSVFQDLFSNDMDVLTVSKFLPTSVSGKIIRSVLWLLRLTRTESLLLS